MIKSKATTYRGIWNSKQPPWKRVYKSIVNRTTKPSHNRYKNYGGRGIRCLITEQQIKDLWFRDEASKMERPSIDRIDINGHYEVKNCRFIELRHNSIFQRNDYCLAHPNCPKGHPFTDKNTIFQKLKTKTGREYLSRRCRKCKAKYGADRYWARKAKAAVQ